MLEERPLGMSRSLLGVQGTVVRLSKRLPDLAGVYFDRFFFLAGEIWRTAVKNNCHPAALARWDVVVRQTFPKMMWRDVTSVWSDWFAVLRTCRMEGAKPAGDDREYVISWRHERLMTATLPKIAQRHSIPEDIVIWLLEQDDLRIVIAPPDAKPASEAASQTEGVADKALAEGPEIQIVGSDDVQLVIGPPPHHYTMDIPGRLGASSGKSEETLSILKSAMDSESLNVSSLTCAVNLFFHKKRLGRKVDKTTIRRIVNGATKGPHVATVNALIKVLKLAPTEAELVWNRLRRNKKISTPTKSAS
jgi:hypothetical protein